MSSRTTTGPAPVTASQRHHFVDALRGFALLGILVVNIEHIVQPSPLGWSEYTSSLDRAVRWFVITFATTKIYPIFATLFGYGLGLQFQRAANQDAADAKDQLTIRTRRRNVALLVAGIAHGVLFFPGDILALYAIVGAACFRLRTWETAKLVKVAAWVYGIASAVWLTLGALDGATGGSGFSSPPDPNDLVTLRSGSFFDVVSVRFVEWMETFAFLLALQGPAVIASFAIGIVLSRTDLLADPTKHRDRAKHFLTRWSPVGFVIAGTAGWAVLAGIQTETIGFAVGFAVAPLIAASYIAALSLLIGGRTNALAKVLQLAGSMSLTVYLAQSVITSTLSYGYGFGWLGRVGPAAGVGLAFAVWFALAIGASVWMARFRFGPCEWALRSVTYLRRQPLRR